MKDIMGNNIKLTLIAILVAFATAQECENKYDDRNCEAWAEKGYCEHSFVFYMEEYCRKSCNFCNDTETVYECGKPKIFDDQFRIVGGKEVVEGTIPWQASIRLGSLAWCGGSWIGGEYILTAAHCLGQRKSSYSVILGLHNTDPDKDENRKHVVYGIDEMILHEAYDPVTFENDIALIKLKRTVQSQDHIIPVCLPDSSYRIADHEDVTVSGWGYLREGVRESPEALMKVVVQVINREQCKQWMHPNLVTATMLCAGYENGEKDSCQGDSGGPLTERVSGRYRQVGIVSWGIGCARRQKPGIYTEVSRFRNWIKNNSGI